MNKLIFKLFGLLAVFVIGCSPELTGKAAGQIPEEKSNPPEIYFCPRDDCGRIFEKHVRAANISVHCAFYDIDLDNVIGALAQKSRDIEVKVVTDSSNSEGQIKGEGVKFDNDKQLMHNKFCIIDDKIVLTGSFNPTGNDNYKNNNNVVIVYSNFLAKNYEDEFDELWKGVFGNGENVKYPALYVNDIKIQNYFCPEDNCASHVIDLIKNAKSSIYFMTFTFTNGDIADALIEKDNLDIRGIFDSGQSANKYSQYRRLKEFGINVKKDADKYKMHHKVFIIDNRTVVTGSFNPTKSADTKNDENLLVIDDKKIADVFLWEFDNLWD